MKKEVTEYGETEYNLIDGVRHVVPYVHQYMTHAKGRWLYRELLEVLCKEFGGHPKSYWQSAISLGNVRINGNLVSETYLLQNGDLLLHRTVNTTSLFIISRSYVIDNI